MIYEVEGSFEFPDIPTEQLVDVILYYSKHLLKPSKYNKERPVFISRDLELISINIIKELDEAHRELKKNEIKRKIELFPYLNLKYCHYLENHVENRIFAQFIEEEKHKLILALSLFSYRDYSLVLEQAFREHFFEYKFIAYLSSYFYYESRNFDKKIRYNKEREAIVLDSPMEGGATLKDVLLIEQENIEIENLEELFSNELLTRSFKLLTSNQKSILILYFVEGYKDAEIAKKLAISPQAVSKSKRKAIERLRIVMKE
jgi:RNA polymerase sigma factor (sigma-70 family)